MKIVSIFADKLHAFHYHGEEDNELERLLQLWRDVGYVYGFLAANRADIPKGIELDEFAMQIMEWADDIERTLFMLANDRRQNLNLFFKPLHNYEYSTSVTLSLQKGKKYDLRLYAIKIDDNCYVITGGAIKLTHLMQEKEHTRQELTKLAQCRDFLKQNGVDDADSFQEFLNEQL